MLLWEFFLFGSQVKSRETWSTWRGRQCRDDSRFWFIAGAHTTMRWHWRRLLCRREEMGGQTWIAGSNEPEENWRMKTLLSAANDWRTTPPDDGTKKGQISRREQTNINLFSLIEFMFVLVDSQDTHERERWGRRNDDDWESWTMMPTNDGELDGAHELNGGSSWCWKKMKPAGNRSRPGEMRRWISNIGLMSRTHRQGLTPVDDCRRRGVVANGRWTPVGTRTVARGRWMHREYNFLLLEYYVSLWHHVRFWEIVLFHSFPPRGIYRRIYKE